MSQVNANVVAPLGYTGPALTGDNNYVQIIDTNGDSVFKSIPSNSNTAVGKSTLTNTTGQYNTAVGAFALNLNTTGDSNTALGLGAGSGAITATKSVFIGENSGGLTQAGNENTAVGSRAGYGQNPFGASTGMGSGNTCIGAKTGGQLTGGTYNTFIGWEAGFTETTGTNNICIGKSSTSSSLTASNSITLGNSSNNVLRCAVQTITGLSDARDKKEVKDLNVGLEFIDGLRPVTFIWDDRDENGKHDIADFGFIAQELKTAQEDADMADVLKLVYDENPEKLEASYGKLIPILVKAVQELSAEVKQLKNK